MSLSRTVYLDRSKMLDPAAWAAAIRASGFELDLDTSFDVETFTGFLPCRYEGREHGFEYTFERVDEMELDDDEIRSQIGDRDVAISFATHADLGGSITAWIAAAVLCARTDGVLHDDESGEIIRAREALATGKEMERSLRDGARADTGVSDTLRRGFDVSLRPLLERVGFVSCTPTDVDYGVVAAAASRLLSDGRTVEARLWCEAATGDHLRFRLYLHGMGGGPIPLQLPWRDSARTFSLEFAGGEFLPRNDVGQLATAVEFLAGAFAASADQLTTAIPELESVIRDAADQPAWQQAVRRGEVLWRDRFLRGQSNDRLVAATVVFVGAKLVLLEAEGTRFSFKFDTASFDRTLPTSLSGWYTSPAGDPVPTRVINGANSWLFNHRGELTPPPAAP